MSNYILIVVQLRRHYVSILRLSVFRTQFPDLHGKCCFIRVCSVNGGDSELRQKDFTFIIGLPIKLLICLSLCNVIRYF